MASAIQVGLGAWAAHRVAVFNGQTDTHIETGDDYRTLFLSEIFRMEPGRRPKGASPAFIPSSYCDYDAREHAKQRERGQFVALCGDVDKGDHALDRIQEAVEAAVGDAAYLIYSSAHARPGDMRWRIIIPLERAIPFADWHDAQLAFFAAMEAAGVQMDHALARAAQPVYLPNVPDIHTKSGTTLRDEAGQPFYYQRAATDFSAPGLDIRSAPIADGIDAIRQQRAADGIAAAGAVFEGASLIKSSVEYGRQLQETAKQIGLTTEELQVYQIAAKQAGVSNSQLATSFGQFQDNLGKAQTGSKDIIRIFAALGISTKDLKTFTDAGSALPTIIDRLSAIQDPAKRAAVGYKLFGDTYRQLDPILAGGNQKIADLTKQLQAAGAILSDGQIDKLADASKILGDLSDKLKVDVAGVVADNAKSIEDLATSLSKLTVEVIKFIDAHPEAAFAIIGGLMGGSAGGLPGVAIGTVAGYAAGAHIAATAADTNMDPAFRRQQLANAQAELAARQQAAAGQTPAGGTSILGGLITLRHSPTENSGATIASAQAEVDRQKALLAQATAEPKPVPKRTVVGGTVNNRLLNQINAPQGEEEKLRKEALERTKRYNDQMARLQDQLLDAEMQQAVGSDAQLKLKQQQIKTDHDRTEADIKSALAEKKLNDADAANLLKKNDELEVQRNAVLALQKRVDLYDRINDIAQQDMQAQEDILQSQASMAKTAADRRRLGLQALDLQKQAQDKADRDIIKSPDPNVTDSDRAKAQDRLNNSDATYAQKRAELEYGTRGPLKEYLDSLPGTAKELDEALQQASVDGLKSLNDGLTTAIGKFLHLHGIAGQFIEDLIKIALEHEALALFNGGTGSLFSSIGSILGIGRRTDSLSSGPFAGTQLGASAIPGLAGGGSLTIAGNGGIDRNLLSINGQPVARVNQGETLNIVPANQQARTGGGATNIVVVQPIHADFSGARTDEQTMRQFVAYTDARSKQARDEAVRIAGSQVGPIVQRKQTLGN